jgi:hypothetical protein
MEVLVKFAEATGAKMWFTNDKWLTNAHICLWYGVTCNTKESVIGLDLRDNGLQLQAGFEDVDILALLSGLSFIQAS